MGALIMSLLFLSNILDPFQALDDAGRPIPHAVLTFWHSQTSAPATVYADQELLIELSDAQGRVVADAQGIFPLIYLDPDTLYRVRLQTGEGVLRWDVDPYLCDCTDPPRLFRNPLHQTLTRIEGLIPRFEPPPVPGARLIFTDYNTDAPVRVWADAARKVPLRNPLPSNAAGIFPPVYLEDDVEYRVRLVAPDGTVLIDADPYECFCGFLLLTSLPYSLLAIESLGTTGTVTRVRPEADLAESLLPGAAVISAMSRAIVQEYDRYAPESLMPGGTVLSATSEITVLPPVEYDQEPEALTSAATILSAASADIVQQYDEYEPEAVGSAASILSATSTSV